MLSKAEKWETAWSGLKTDLIFWSRKCGLLIFQSLKFKLKGQPITLQYREDGQNEKVLDSLVPVQYETWSSFNSVLTFWSAASHSTRSAEICPDTILPLLHLKPPSAGHYLDSLLYVTQDRHGLDLPLSWDASFSSSSCLLFIPARPSQYLEFLL